MRIGRLLLLAPQDKLFSYEKGECGCILVEGLITFVWFAKDCKCAICNQYVCECKQDE